MEDTQNNNEAPQAAAKPATKRKGASLAGKAKVSAKAKGGDKKKPAAGTGKGPKGKVAAAAKGRGRPAGVTAKAATKKAGKPAPAKAVVRADAKENKRLRKIIGIMSGKAGNLDRLLSKFK